MKVDNTIATIATIAIVDTMETMETMGTMGDMGNSSLTWASFYTIECPSSSSPLSAV